MQMLFRGPSSEYGGETFVEIKEGSNEIQKNWGLFVNIISKERAFCKCEKFNNVIYEVGCTPLIEMTIPFFPQITLLFLLFFSLLSYVNSRAFSNISA